MMNAFILPDWKEEHDQMVARNNLEPTTLFPDSPFNFYPYRSALEQHVLCDNAYLVQLSTRDRGVRNEAIGLVCMKYSAEQFQSHIVNIDLFWIHRDFRNRGWGKCTMMNLIFPQVVKIHGVKTVTLECVDNNIKFWRDSCGFQCSIDSDDFWSYSMFKSF